MLELIAVCSDLNASSVVLTLSESLLKFSMYSMDRNTSLD